MDLKDIGFKVRTYREKRGLTETELGKHVNLGQSAINKIENGGNTTIKKIIEIARFLKIPEYELFSDVPLIPYESKEPQLQFDMPDADFVGIKQFEDPIILGPGRTIDEEIPSGYLPLLKSDLPRGYKSEPDRIISFKTQGASMKSTINDGSYIWIDRYTPESAIKEGGIYAFLLPDESITVKRLIRNYKTKGYCIIDGDNYEDKEERENGCLKDYPMIIKLSQDISIIRGRIIWILNRLIEKPKKNK